MKLLQQKKGFVQDAITIIITLFTIGVIFVVGLMFFSGLSSGLNESLTTPETAKGLEIATYTNDTIDWVMDFIFAMLFISLPIASMILAFFNNIPNFFFWGSLGIVLLVVVLGGAFADSWGSMNSDSVIGIQMARLPITSIIMNNFGLYSFFIIVIILAGTYIKTQQGGAY